MKTTRMDVEPIQQVGYVPHDDISKTCRVFYFNSYCYDDFTSDIVVIHIVAWIWNQ